MVHLKIWNKNKNFSIPLSVSFQTIPSKTTLVPGSQEPKEDSSVTDDWSTVFGCIWWWWFLSLLFDESLFVTVSLFVDRCFFYKREKKKERIEWMNEWINWQIYTFILSL